MPVRLDRSMHIDDAIEQFVSEHSAGNTQHTYRSALKAFADYTSKPIVRSLTTGDALDWIKSLKLAPNTINHRIVVIRTFYDHLMRHKLIEEDSSAVANFEFALRNRRVKIELLPKSLEPSEVAALLQAAQDEPEPAKPTKNSERLHELTILRNSALIPFMESSMLRASAIVSLKRGDLKMAKRSGQVMTKGGVEQPFDFSTEARDALMRYLTLRDGSKVSRDLDSLPLFSSHNSKTTHPITVRRLDQIFQILCERAKISPHTPHGMRHTGAQRVYDVTNDLEATRLALGHKSIATTTRYARAGRTKAKEVHDQVFG